MSPGESRRKKRDTTEKPKSPPSKSKQKAKSGNKGKKFNLLLSPTPNQNEDNLTETDSEEEKILDDKAKQVVQDSSVQAVQSLPYKNRSELLRDQDRKLEMMKELGFKLGQEKEWDDTLERLQFKENNLLSQFEKHKHLVKKKGMEDPLEPQYTIIYLLSYIYIFIYNYIYIYRKVKITPIRKFRSIAWCVFTWAYLYKYVQKNKASIRRNQREDLEKAMGFYDELCKSWLMKILKPTLLSVYAQDIYIYI